LTDYCDVAWGNGMSYDYWYCGMQIVKIKIR